MTKNYIFFIGIIVNQLLRIVHWYHSQKCCERRTKHDILSIKIKDNPESGLAQHKANSEPAKDNHMWNALKTDSEHHSVKIRRVRAPLS